MYPIDDAATHSELVLRLARVRRDLLGGGAIPFWVGIPDRLWAHYEGGGDRIPPAFLQHVAARLDISLNWLVTGEGEPEAGRAGVPVGL